MTRYNCSQALAVLWLLLLLVMLILWRGLKWLYYELFGFDVKRESIFEDGWIKMKEEMSDLPHYTKEQFGKLVKQLQASFLVTAIDYEANLVGTLQGQEGWRLMLLHLDLEGQTASFKVWVAKGEDNVDAKV